MYSAKVRRRLREIEIGDKVEVRKGKKIYKGILMPRIAGDKDILIVKLDNGYNIGVKDFDMIKKIKGKKEKTERKKGKIKWSKNKPIVSILGAGGTIASRVDYRTGAVKPSVEAEELIEFTPEISDIANIRGRQVLQKFSENMEPKDWKKIAMEIKKEIDKGVDGVVVMHGTDTMAYTSAALSFMFGKLSVPVVLVGAQRSSDRPSSDSHMNLTCAVKAATSGIPEVMVCMHGESSDTFCYLHSGVRVRKNHTSRRDAFTSYRPIGKVDWSGLRLKKFEETRKPDNNTKVNTKMEGDVSYIKVHPGSALSLGKEKGLVIEGTGLGHLPMTNRNKRSLKKFNGIKFMASQTLRGKTNMNVYETGRVLKDMGFIGNYIDMVPETAYVKLMWVLGQDKKEAKKLMLKNLRGEFIRGEI